jgi:Tol biopolymer transport system component
MSRLIRFRSLAALALLVAIACSDDSPSAPVSIPVASVTVNPTAHSLVVGTSTTLTAALADANGRPITGRPIAWISNRPDVATVTAAGVVTAVTAGVASIDVSSEDKHATAVITVTRVPVARVDITPATLSLVEGETGALSATAKDANGAVLEDRPVTWRSSDVDIAPIYANGQILAIRPGTVTITAESEGKAATLELTVAAVPVANVNVSPLAQPLETGDVFSLTATVTDASGRVLSGRAITWSTSNALVATIAPNGQVTARGTGDVTLTATSEGKTGSVTSFVDVPPAASLLYQRTTPLSNEIFTLRLAPGQTPARVNAGNVSQQPAVSPDGSRIAFFVSMMNNGEAVEDIFAVDRVGTNMKRLTTKPGVDNAPAWSPTADLIAYHSLDVTTGRSDIWVMNGDGSAPRNLTADLPADLARDEPAWSPDGQWIAFTQSRGTAGPGRGSIWIMRADGSDKRQVTLHPDNGFDLSPSWSPDGQRIAFFRGGIAIVTLATGGVEYLGLPGRAFQPAWSPDGRHIAFAWQPSEPGSGEWQLYTVRPNGTGMRLRTTNPAWGGGVSPAWLATQR